MILRSAGLAVILLAAVTLGTAQGVNCLGNCSVYCDSGQVYYSYGNLSNCCSRATSLCPDGSSAYYSEWWPDSCGEAFFCWR